MNLHLIIAVIGQDPVDASLFELFDHFWSVVEFFFAVNANFLEGAIFIIQPNRIKISTFFHAKWLKNNTSNFSCRITRCGKEINLEVLGFEN